MLNLSSITGPSDWEWWDEVVPQKLRQLNSSGYRVVFFTNQAGIEKLKTKAEDITKKVEDMIAELGIPVLVRGENCCLFHLLSDIYENILLYNRNWEY